MERLLKSRFKIGEQISENPYSLTYKGSFLDSDKPIVIKIYKRGALNSNLINRMKQKVREFSLVNHHNIAKLIDGDYGWQGFYYVREYIDGKSLRQILDESGRIDPDRAVAVVEEVCRAVGIAHSRGIIHGALKPENVFLDKKGLVKVTDFVIEGAIKEAMPQKALAVIAQRDSFAPEELLGEAASASSDIYGLGRILQQAAQEPPKYLQDIIDKALQKDPLLRFSSVAEFLESLEKHGVVEKNTAGEEFLAIFESTVTRYGGERVDRESEALQDLGRVRLRWNKEKHRNWLLSVMVGLAVLAGLLYAFIAGR